MGVENLTVGTDLFFSSIAVIFAVAASYFTVKNTNKRNSEKIEKLEEMVDKKEKIYNDKFELKKTTLDNHNNRIIKLEVQLEHITSGIDSIQDSIKKIFDILESRRKNDT